MSDSLMAEVPERDATGRVAELYEDIRATQQLQLVNLIWRHLATRPGALEWAWSIARPLYASGLAREGFERLTEAVELPVIPPAPTAATDALGLSHEDRRSIRSMLRSYNRGNGPNLIALSAVLLPAGSRSSTAPPDRNAATVDQADELEPLPALLPLAELPDEVQRLVLDINRMGTGDAREPIVASLYRHLGYWPGYLALAWAQLAPLDDDGRLERAIARVLQQANSEAAALSAHRGEATNAEPADVDFARREIEAFRDTAIGRMVTIGLLLEPAIR